MLCFNIILFLTGQVKEKYTQMYMLLIVIKSCIAVLPLIRSLTRIILQCDPHEQGRLEYVGEPMLVDNLVQFVSSVSFTKTI